MEGSSGHMNYPAGQKKDQCLFINYYKVKRRIWGLLKTIKAAAGPDNREPEDDDEDEGSVILSEESVVEELEMEEVRNPGLCRQILPHSFSDIRSCRHPPRLYLGLPDGSELLRKYLTAGC